MFAQICSKSKTIFCERFMKYFVRKNYLGQLTEGKCLGGNYLECNYQEVIYPGDNYPGAICLEDNFSERN